MRIFGVNGIRTDGSNNIDRLLYDLRDKRYQCVDVDYPQVNVLTARSRQRQIDNAYHLLDDYEPGDAVIAHSYGCLITLRAMELGARFGHVFFFGAAMNDDFSFPAEGMARLHNFHNPDDVALSFGKLMFWHDFGGMGQTGYDGPPDDRIKNLAMAQESKFWSLNHSHYFEDAHRPTIARYIHDTLQAKKYG